MRSFAKREVAGLLSSKVINLRKEVELQRQHLRQLHRSKEELFKRRQGLESELRTIETAEKRRNDVSLETEKSLTEAKYEISQLRKEVHFLDTNRGDLELALGSLNEEKRMLERELISIRGQLQIRGGGGNTMRAPLHPHSMGGGHNNSTSQLLMLKPGDAYFNQLESHYKMNNVVGSFGATSNEYQNNFPLQQQ